VMSRHKYLTDDVVRQESTRSGKAKQPRNGIRSSVSRGKRGVNRYQTK
jgi:hypothetical protein